MLLQEVSRAEAQLVVLEDLPQTQDRLRKALSDGGFQRLVFYPAQATCLSAHLRDSAQRPPGNHPTW